MRTTNRHFGLSMVFGGASLGLALALGAFGCKGKSNRPAQVADLNSCAVDPASANLASVGTATPSTDTPYNAPGAGGTASCPDIANSGQAAVLSSSAAAPQSQSGETYQAAPAQSSSSPAYGNPGYQNAAPNQGYQNQNYQDPGYQGQGYAPGGGYGGEDDQSAPVEYAQQPPPPLPEYQQPELTQPGYVWTPGYWSWGPDGYYWVPGAWVDPPYQQALWTPGYWGYNGGDYGFHLGYWARHIGYYGGIDYGFGYGGFGYQGGYWNNNQFYYNDAVNRVDLNTVRTVYLRNVPVANNAYRNNHLSYNGPGGYNAVPRPAELAVLRERRMAPLPVQQQRVQQAVQNRQNLFAVNRGRPAQPVANERLVAARTPPPPLSAPPIQQRFAAPVRAERGGFGQPTAIQQRTAQPAPQPQAQQFSQQRSVQLQQQQQMQVRAQQQRAQQYSQQRNVQMQQQQIQAQALQQRAQQMNRQQQVRPQPQPRPLEQVRPAQPNPEPSARPEPQRPEPRPQGRLRP